MNCTITAAHRKCPKCISPSRSDNHLSNIKNRSSYSAPVQTERLWRWWTMWHTAQTHGRAALIFRNCDEVRPLHRTEPFSQNGVGAAGDHCTPRIPECTTASEVNVQLLPPSRGTQKCAARENLPMSKHSIEELKAIASLMEILLPEFWAAKLGVQHLCGCSPYLSLYSITIRWSNQWS